VLDCLAPAKKTLQSILLSTWLPDAALPADQFRLLEKLGEFTALKKVAVDYPAIVHSEDDFDTLVELLRGMEELECVFLLEVAWSQLFEGEFERFLQAVRVPEWPRLKAVVLHFSGHMEKDTESGDWEELVSRLRGMVEKNCDGSGVVGQVWVMDCPGSVVMVSFRKAK
jgi:hypothetical protein